MSQTLEESTEEVKSERVKWEEQRKEWHRHLTQMVRDVEKVQVQLERKVQLELFTQALEQKADKQMVVNATINKVGKIDLEQLLALKQDRAVGESATLAVQARIDEEVASLSAAVSRKANLEDMAYYRKELAGKLEKPELEAFRQEFVDRVAQFDHKMQERNLILQQFGEALEQKVDVLIGQARHQINMQMDTKVESEVVQEMKAEMRALFEKAELEANAHRFETQKKHETVISGIIRTNEENSDKFGHLSLKLKDQGDL